MFTGIIETVGEVAEVKPTPAGFRLRLQTELSNELTPGESMAVNGVCLTVVAADADGVHMDVSPETIRVTAFGSLKRGASVNLERPMRVDSRVGGHFVQGHVDATGAIEEIRQDGALRGPGAIGIECDIAFCHAPLVEQRVAGTAVESEYRP